VTFTVWAGETTAISESQSGIARVASAPRNSDAAILSEFLGIPTLLGRLDRRPALLSRYSEPWALA
jgi:hypothetical protein